MLIEKRIHENGDVTLSLSGKLDTITSGLFRKEAASVPEETKRLILDLRETVYISSSGLRELLICRKRFPEERMLIRNITAPVREILEMTGFDLFLPIEVLLFEKPFRCLKQSDAGLLIFHDEDEAIVENRRDRGISLFAFQITALQAGKLFGPLTVSDSKLDKPDCFAVILAGALFCAENAVYCVHTVSPFLFFFLDLMRLYQMIFAICIFR